LIFWYQLFKCIFVNVLFEHVKMVKKQQAAIQLSLIAVMSALVAAGTLIVRIPNPMGGYFNVGDVMIFVAALTFGPLVGGASGGLGSAIADIIGFPLFAVPTLVIKGLEGLIAGLITNKKSVYRDIFAVVMAGAEMIIGYFLVEVYLWGVGGALAEVPANIAQIAVGGIIGVPIAIVFRRRLPEILSD
jgi:uncharacterized membrane protein